MNKNSGGRTPNKLIISLLMSPLDDATLNAYAKAVVGHGIDLIAVGIPPGPGKNVITKRILRSVGPLTDKKIFTRKGIGNLVNYADKIKDIVCHSK